MEQTRVKKKCARCGHVGMVAPFQRHCYRPRFGKGSYACWGLLERMVNKEETVRQFEEHTGSPAPSVAQQRRAAAIKKRDAAQRKVNEWVERVSSAAKNLSMWRSRLDRFAKQAAMTDGQIAAQSERGRKAAAVKAEPKIKRAIRVPRSTISDEAIDIATGKKL